MTFNKRNLYKKYMLYDLCAAVVVWIAFFVFRKTINDIRIFEGASFIIPFYNYFLSFCIFPVFSIFIHSLTGFYTNSIKKSRINSIFCSFSSAIIISTIVFFVLKIKDVTVSSEYFYFSLFVLFSLEFGVTYFFRAIVFSWVKTNFRTKKWTINTLVIGVGEHACKIATEIDRHAFQNTLVGFVSTDKNTAKTNTQLLGSMANIGEIINKYHVEEAIVALDNNADEKQLFKIINQLYRYDIDILFTPRLYEILTGSAKISRLGIVPFVSITQPTMSDWESSVKRVIDIFVSITSLVLLSPFLIAMALFIKLDSKGPAFYFQERVGRYGKPFRIVKFRTMYVGAENGTPKLSSENDARITNFGKFLRKYRLDEIPQFWNILKGEMSLVGPRPERKYYINQIIEQAPYYCLLYKIRPGLTSWGPIRIGYADTTEKMIERLNFDIIYMENMSLINDIKILVYTVEILLKGKGV